VSVVIPVYNGRAYLEGAVKTVLAQTRAPLEVLVVDDGSTDGTRELAASLAPRVALIAQANQGAGAARNVGVARARGSHVAFLDVDDRWTPEKLAKQMAVFERHPEVAVVGSRLAKIDRQDRPLPSPGRILPRAQYDRPASFREVLLMTGNVVPLSSAVVRRDVFQSAGGFRVEPNFTSEDYDLWVRLAEDHPFYLFEEPLMLYRELPDSRLHGSLEKEYESQKKVIDANRARYGGDRRYRRRLAKLYFDWALDAAAQSDASLWGKWRLSAAHDPWRWRLWFFGLKALAAGLVRRAVPASRTAL
jgi:glycosyltransferase involved in cell wall biosynthesis